LCSVSYGAGCHRASTADEAAALPLNTSIVIRALEDPAVRGFLEECCTRHRCVVGSVHGLEGWRPGTLEAVEELLGRLGVERGSST